MSRIKRGRRQDRVKRKGRTYYAIDKDSTHIFRFAAFEDRQHAVETENLDPLTAQEFMQFKLEGKVQITEVPKRINLISESNIQPTMPTSATVSESPQPSPPSYTEPPQNPNVPSNVTAPTTPAATSMVTPTTALIPAVVPSPSAVSTQEPVISFTQEEFKATLVAAIVEALRQYHSEFSRKSGHEAGAIAGEQPTGSRQNPNH